MARAGNLCNTHYMRKYRTGKVGKAEIAPARRYGCLADGCDREHHSLGYCVVHASRRSRHGGLHSTWDHSPTCEVDGCNRPYYAKGYCKCHYYSEKVRHNAAAHQPNGAY